MIEREFNTKKLKELEKTVDYLCKEIANISNRLAELERQNVAIYNYKEEV